MAKDKAPGTVTSAQLAEVLDCTTRQVEKYAEAGLVVKVARGQYHFLSSIRNVVTYLRKQAAQTASSDGKETAADENILLRKSQRRLTDLRIQQMEGQLIALDEIEDVWSALVTANRQLVLSIPGRARLELPHLNGHDQKVLTDLCHDILRETALGEGRMPAVKAATLEGQT